MDGPSYIITRFLEEEIKCTILSDDPLLFGCNVSSKYRLCLFVQKIADSTFAQFLKTSFAYGCAPERTKSRGIEGVIEWLFLQRIGIGTRHEAMTESKKVNAHAILYTHCEHTGILIMQAALGRTRHKGCH